MGDLESCKPQPKTVHLDPAGSGALIEYEMYQRVCFPFNATIKLDIEQTHVDEVHTVPIKDNFWEVFPMKPVQELREYVRFNFPTVIKESSIVKDVRSEAVEQLLKLATQGRDSTASTVGRTGAVKAGFTTGEQIETTESKIDQIVARIQGGERPVLQKRMSGEDQIGFEKAPKKPAPELFMIMHYRTCVFQGKYGLGKVVGCMDLLPGEKREISVQTYEHSEESRSRSQSIFDSFSASSANSFENTLTQTNSVTTDHTVSETKTPKSFGFNLGFAGASVGFNKSGGKGSTVSDNSSTHAETINSAITKHSSEANSAREVKIGSETTSSISQGTDTSVIRMLENLNWSRTLNFIFRQMNQRYTAITYLDDVSFVFRNGFDTQISSIALLPDLIDKITPDDEKGKEHAEQILASIRLELCNFRAYDCKYHAFVECIEEGLTDCCDPKHKATKRVVMRKKCGFKMCHQNFCVPGIIIGVQDFVMRTTGVFVDTVMGQNESLDCYNSRLQDAAAESKELDNEVRVNREELIQSQPNPQNQATVAADLRRADCCPDVECGCKGGD